MRYIISGKNIDITPGLKEAAENKIGKLERYFSPDTEVQVTMSVEKGRQKIEVTIPVKGSIIRAEQDSNDMYVSIDLVEEIIERQDVYKRQLLPQLSSGQTLPLSGMIVHNRNRKKRALQIMRDTRRRVHL